MINLFIISDITIYREGLNQILSTIGSINVTGAFDTIETVLSGIEARPPDVALLDMTMEGSCDLAQHLIRNSSDIKIVALAIRYDERNILQCAEAGITGFVPREAPVNVLIDAILGAAKGECYCPPQFVACILKNVQVNASSVRNNILPSISATREVDNCFRGMLQSLTARERQIALLLSDGLSNKQIARDLFIEVSTVKNHVHNLLVKLEVKSRGQAASLLLQEDYRYASRSI